MMRKSMSSNIELCIEAVLIEAF